MRVHTSLHFILGAGVGVGTGEPADPAPTDPPADPQEPQSEPKGTPEEPKKEDDEPLGEGGKKALEAERARAKALEKEVTKYKDAAEKDRLAKLDDKQRAEAERDKAAEDAAKARAELAIERAARKHGITDDKDLELLAGVPADKVDALAKRLAATNASATPAGRSGNGVGGERPKPKPTTLDGAIGAHYSN